jgi:hypothetical protein
MPDPTPTHRLLDLDVQASTLLDVLVEAGHLDDDLLEEVNDRLLDQRPDSGLIDLAIMRRVVATVLFEREDKLDPELKRIVDQEWGLLFG